jgi:excisionase family DNA binding protein
MEVTGDQWELFPNIAKAKPKAKGRFREFLDACDEHGPLMTQAMAAVGLDLGRSRVGQLVDEGRIATVRVGEERLIPLAAFELFVTEERKSGRPWPEPTLRQAIRTAIAERKENRK